VIKAILTLITFAVSLGIILFFGFLAGCYCTLDYCNEGLKEIIPIVQPQQEPEKFLRYGGGDGFESQMKAIRRLGKQEVWEEWEEWTIAFRPWNTLKGAL